MRRASTLISGLAATLLLVGVTTVPAQADDKAAAKRLAGDIRRAWQTTRGKGSTVAVLSSGVDPRVRTLSGHVSRGPDYFRGRSKRLEGTLLASIIAGSGPQAKCRGKPLRRLRRRILTKPQMASTDSTSGT